ncbi:hypothetical protein NA57DRAFT_77945 [Rhizodiscina lignyota]|uniref:Uncharacterized protein n=1 Tax=Rhizodiscina lignyota TaxID=1504668 RepID=A0A9P4M431_9PEZI|nr:hypothetical protein NA57DRAFT_77945 [Rhizodiscina lignyota]
MVKSNGTSSVPRTKSKQLSKAREPPKKTAPLSQEFIEDSDDDSTTGPANGTGTTKQNRPVVQSVKKATPTKLKSGKAAQPSRPSPSSESSDDDEPDADSPLSSKATRVNGVKGGAAKSKDTQNGSGTSESDAGNDSDSSSEDAESQAPKMNGSAAQAEDTDSDPDEAESGSDSEDDSDSDDASSSTSASDDGNLSPPRNHVSQARPVRPFHPPPGFKVVRPSDTSASMADLHSAIKAGHQIWHISAPKGVPVTSIKEMALQKALQGEPVLTFKDIDYCFNAEDQQNSSKLLIPNSDGYGASPVNITQTLCLQQVVKLPNLSAKQADPLRGSDAAAPLRAPAIKRKREQPGGLRMRFQPIGVIDNSSIGEDPSIDPTSAIPQVGKAEFRVPPPLPKSVMNSAEKKRKHDETLEERAARKAAKKSQKAAKKTDNDAISGKRDSAPSAKKPKSQESGEKNKKKHMPTQDTNG